VGAKHLIDSSFSQIQQGKGCACLGTWATGDTTEGGLFFSGASHCEPQPSHQSWLFHKGSTFPGFLLPSASCKSKARISLTILRTPFSPVNDIAFDSASTLHIGPSKCYNKPVWIDNPLPLQEGGWG
jgi:hypothetical protein